MSRGPLSAWQEQATGMREADIACQPGLAGQLIALREGAKLKQKRALEILLAGEMSWLCSARHRHKNRSRETRGAEKYWCSTFGASKPRLAEQAARVHAVPGGDGVVSEWHASRPARHGGGRFFELGAGTCDTPSCETTLASACNW